MNVEADNSNGDLTSIIQQLSNDFDTMCNDRHLMGAEKYGPIKFMSADSFEEMVEEIVDLANYARYTFIKLRLFQKFMADEAEKLDARDKILGIAGWKEVNE